MNFHGTICTMWQQYIKAVFLAVLTLPMGLMGAEVTGRTSMGLRDPNQCRLPYSGDEQVSELPIVGVDGTTFGSNRDGVVTSVCGKRVKIGGVMHIVADRIYQNEGLQGYLYDSKYNADHRQWPIGKGYTQFDTAIYTFKQRGGVTKHMDVEWVE